MKKRGFDSKDKKYDVIHEHYKEKFSGDEFRPDTPDMLLMLRKMSDAVQADNEEKLSRPYVVCADINGNRKKYAYKTSAAAYMKYMWLTRKNRSKKIRAVTFFEWATLYGDLITVLRHMNVTKYATKTSKGTLLSLPYDLQEQAIEYGWVDVTEGTLRVTRTVNKLKCFGEDIDLYVKRAKEINYINTILN